MSIVAAAFASRSDSSLRKGRQRERVRDREIERENVCDRERVCVCVS